MLTLLVISAVRLARGFRLNLTRPMTIAMALLGVMRTKVLGGMVGVVGIVVLMVVLRVCAPSGRVMVISRLEVVCRNLWWDAVRLTV